MDYQNSETILMYTDDTNNPQNYYQEDGQIHSFQGSEAIGTIRIPPKIYEKFANNSNALLCDGPQQECDSNQDSLTNETIVSWGINGIYKPISDKIKFKIIPTTAVLVNENPSIVDLLHDNNLREDAINYTSNTANNPSTIEYSNSLINKYNPITHNSPYLLKQHNVIASNEDQIKNASFPEIFQNSFSNLTLKLTHLLKSRNEHIYPFLEYKLSFDQPVSDRFYHLDGIGKVGNYEVHILLSKPTSQQSIVGDFTIIF
ncbi:MAG: hypothetical protein GXP45_03425 [bacterium]|nr:hypothetical protein [bacterium]